MRIREILAANVLALFCILTRSIAASFLIKTIYVKLTTFSLVRTIKNEAKWMLNSERTFKIKEKSRWTVFEISLATTVIRI